ncbi:deoxyribodipyrimidine photo-lyase [Seongchinamella unica]|uniref:Deoxyribodipyrimidine photo-lyase n=1 Tax=Seongchinamella unica TaxID=2547392 RepID=A0A4R5LNI0_9GAMM|nr:deoxyribodipyrimidine photo-lyase [Seongchinamella unica]TDG11909.1 deoxyribodipyrimidine photo-lyase [Seongchinamella unica]
MSASQPVIYWFRQDLRLSDLPALKAAAASGCPVIPCFFIDDETPGEWAPGGASRWWLHHSLVALGKEISQKGGRLVVRRGDSRKLLAEVVEETGAQAVYCSEAYEPWNRELQRVLSADLEQANARLHCHEGSLLFHPDAIRNKAGQPFKVFTPYWRHCRELGIAAPGGRQQLSRGRFHQHRLQGLKPAEWGLLPESPNWADGWLDHWTPGAKGARASLNRFTKGALDGYSEGRDFPALNGSSRLSPHLHWGELSPRQACAAILDADSAGDSDQQKFIAEIGWREFNYHLLYHHPHIPERPFKPRFEQLPWADSQARLGHWQQGKTGYPIVDAGMRELWHTGFMHNRVRMVCASFLTKHLLLPWQWGARWFWDTLVDADLANNSCGWQWVAGCGADAAPYFRIFNPVLQGKRFDAGGDYIRRWVPELGALPDRYLHAPWEAPADTLAEAGITLGDHYPEPMVDHREARAAALEAYDVLPSGDDSG